MQTIKPIKTNPMHPAQSNSTDAHEKLTSAEQGKLWATYIGNTMSVCVLRYMLHHVKDPEIKTIMEQALSVSQRLVQHIKLVFERERYPVPKGFGEEDVNVNAPRLFEDEFYLHYLKYLAKAGISLYGIAIPLVTRSDVRAFFTDCIEATVNLINQVNELMIKNGLIAKPAFIPYPEKIDFVRKQSYLNGFLGDVRPLQALEITHLHDNLENNSTSKAVLIGFSQVTAMEQARKYFIRGKGIASKHYEVFRKLLQEEDLPSPPLLDALVTTSTIPPFSERLMLFHKVDMFTVRIRAYGNAISMSPRHDIAEKYARLTLEVGNFLEDGANILIDHGWFEQPPKAADREALAAK